MTAIKLAKRYKHQPLNGSVSPDESELVHELICAPEEDAAALALLKLNRRGLATLLDETLSDPERRVLCFHLEGLSYDEITDRTGFSRKRVDNTLQRAKRKLRNSITFTQLAV